MDIVSTDAALVSTSWLAGRLNEPGIVVLDCTWYLPEAGKRGADDFVAGHIPGARHLDLEGISDQASPFANMLPTAAHFAAEVGRLGVGNADMVVLYDRSYVAARLWWMFRIFGHRQVAILDGGWRGWVAEGRAVETGVASPVARSFSAALIPGSVADWRGVLAAIEAGRPAILDARTAERFSGAAPSGYPGIPGGHMPGAINIPWSRLFDQDGRMVPLETARAVFAQAGVALDQPATLTCGSGVTAAVLAFTLARLGHMHWRIYDGSWHEWAQLPGVPKQQDVARPVTQG